MLEVLNISGEILKDLLICHVLEGREGLLHFICSHGKGTAEQRAEGQGHAVVLEGVTAQDTRTW